jgi:hypothetical protein
MLGNLAPVDGLINASKLRRVRGNPALCSSLTPVRIRMNSHLLIIMHKIHIHTSIHNSNSQQAQTLTLVGVDRSLITLGYAIPKKMSRTRDGARY